MRKVESEPCGFQDRLNNLALGAFWGFTLQRELAIFRDLGVLRSGGKKKKRSEAV